MIDPNAGRVFFRDYATGWLKARPELSPKTAELYEGQLRLHILPVLGDLPLNRITPSVVREWRAGLFAAGRIGPNTIAKCYRLLHTICATAVDVEVIVKNPCTIKDAGREQYEERVMATVLQVFDLADLVKPQRRALVLLAAFSGLRLSELLALRRRHVDVLHKRVIAREATVELSRVSWSRRGPKSRAGIRKVHLDPVIFAELERHLDVFVGASPDAYLFTGDKGSQLRRAVWHKEWAAARDQAGLPHLHFHDLRHTHGTLAAQSGATTKETMRRQGHSTVQAAIIYQHATDERDHEIARAIGARIEKELGGREGLGKSSGGVA